MILFIVGIVTGLAIDSVVVHFTGKSAVQYVIDKIKAAQSK